MNYVYFFGGAMDGKTLNVPNEPPAQIRIGSETYELQGYDEYTWRYELKTNEQKIKVRIGRKTIELSREAAAALIGALADALAADTSEPGAWEIEPGIE
jgi:hypothetical protein